MKDKNDIAKNWEVVQEEFRLYGEHCRQEVKWIRGLDVSIWRKTHHFSGLGPDIHRMMPRSLWYGSVVLGLLTTGAAGYVAWRVWG